MKMTKGFGRGLLLALALALLSTAAFAYADVTENYWAHPYIETASGAGLCKGYEDGTFRPNGKVTNAEFLTMCVRCALGEPKKETTRAWWQPYWDAAKKADWDIPFAEETVNLSATRYDMARLLQEASPLKELRWGSYLPCAPIESRTYSDLVRDDELENYLNNKAVQWASDSGLLNGYRNGTFGGNQTLTRAEASTVLTRLLCHKRLAEKKANLITANGSVVFYFYVDPENNTHICSETMPEGTKIAEEISMLDPVSDGTPGRNDFRTMQSGNTKYFWGEFGFFSYESDGTMKKWTDRAVLDYGYDETDGSVVAITHEKGKRGFFSGSGVTWASGDEVVRVYPDGREALLLDETAAAEGWKAAGAAITGGVLPQVHLTKVEKIAGGAVELIAEDAWGMGDWHRYRICVENGTLKVLQMGEGSGYSY